MPMSHEALNLKSKNEVHSLKQECFPAAVLGVHMRTGPESPSLSDTTGARGNFLTLTANQQLSILSLKPAEDPNHHHQALTIIGIHQVGIWCPRTKVLPPRPLIPPLSLCSWQYQWSIHFHQYSGNSICKNRHHHFATGAYSKVPVQDPANTQLLPLTVNQLMSLWNSPAVSEHRPKDSAVQCGSLALATNTAVLTLHYLTLISNDITNSHWQLKHCFCDYQIK